MDAEIIRLGSNAQIGIDCVIPTFVHGLQLEVNLWI